MSKRAWLPIAAAAASLAVGTGFGRFSYGLLLPAMERTTLGSFGRAGWLGTVNLVGYLVGVVAVTALAQRVPAGVLLRVGLAGTIVGLAGLAVAPSYTLLIPAMALTGAASAGIWLPVTGIVTSVVEPRRRGVAMGYTVAGVGVGIVVAELLAGTIAHRLGPTSWREVWAGEAAIGLVVLVIVLVTIPVRESARLPGRPGFTALRAMPDRGAILVTYTAFGLGYVMYPTYLVAALERGDGISIRGAGLAFALVGVTSTFGGVLIGSLSDRLGRRRMLFLCQVALVGCALVIPVASLVVADLSAAAFGILMTGVGAVIVAHLADSMEPRHVSAAFGVLTLAFGLVQSAGPPIGGWLVDRTGGFEATFVLAAGAFVVAGAAASRLHRRATSTFAEAASAATSTVNVDQEK